MLCCCLPCPRVRNFGFSLLPLLSIILFAVSSPCAAQDKPAATAVGAAVSVVWVDANSSLPEGAEVISGGPLQEALLAVTSEGDAAAAKGKTLLVNAPPESGLTARALRLPGVIVAGVRNEAQTAATVKVALRDVPRGLWRVDAAVWEGSSGEAAGTTSPRRWRLESTLIKTATGYTSKTLTLAPGQMLVLRWQESVVAAKAAFSRSRGAAREVWSEQMEDAFDTVNAALNSFPNLIARADRKRIATKAHRAVLAAATAQALWANEMAEGGDEGSGEDVFNDLVIALSEISCAAHNLVPRQIVLVDRDGQPAALRVTLTNAGTRTIPLVALGVAPSDEALDASERGAVGAARRQPPQTVFHGVRPGKQVGATFRVKGAEAARGIVQFIVSMGAAVVPVTP